jgi:RNA polymerase sigma factor (sigma-70 family)
MEETKAMPKGVEVETQASESTILLTLFIEDHASSLMGILRGYVGKAGLVSGSFDELQNAALEVLHEVYIEAMKTAAHFDTTRSPKPWLLSIAQKVVMRKRAEFIKRRQHEALMSDLEFERKQLNPDEDPLELIDALLKVKSGDLPEQQLEDRNQVEHLLSLVSERYQYVLRLAILEEKDGMALAEVLGCSYDSALVRLSRARKQLRNALEKQRGDSIG